METHILKNLLKNSLIVLAILLSFDGFGQNSIDKSSYATSLASVIKMPVYKWEVNQIFNEENFSESSIELLPEPCMTLSVNVTNLNCSGDRNGAIDLTVLNNSGPFAYDWQSSFNFLQGATSQDLSNIQPGTYTVTVTSADGCVATKTVTVSYTNVTPTITIDQGLCFGQSTILTVSGANTYTWNTGATTATITATPTNNPYSVIGMASNGCITQMNDVFVSIYTATLSATSQTICINQSATLTASGGISYTWNPGGATGSSLSVTPGTTTIYTVTGTDACSNISFTTATVTVNNSSQPPAVTVSGSTVVCTQGTYTYNASGASSYTWALGSNPYSVNSNSTTVSGLGIPAGSSQILYVTGVDAITGCINTASVTLVNPSPTYTLQNSFINQSSGSGEMCSGSSYTINASASAGSTYTWTPTLTGLSPVASPSVTTDYTFSVSNASCTVNGTFHLIVNATPTISLASPVNVCSGANYAITPTVVGTKTGTVYHWSPAVNLSSTNTFSTVATVYSNTTYSITATNVYQYNLFETPQVLVCQDTKAITFSVLPTPTVNISGGSSTICPGQTTTLTASGATSYTWNTTPTTTIASSITVGVSSGEGAYNGTVPYNGSQTFSVTGSDANGCLAITTYTVSDPVPTVSLNLTFNSDYPTTICSGSSYSLNAQVSSGVTSYTWSPNLTGLNPVITPTATSIYYITVSNGTCTASTHGTIRILPTPTVSLLSPIYICSGSSYTLVPSTNGTNENTLYNWNPNTGLSSNSTATTVANPSSSTNYTLTATNYQYMGGHYVSDMFIPNDTVFCKDTASVSIIIIQNPSVPAITYSTVCGSNFTTLSTTSPNSTYTYTWSGPCYNGTGSSVNVNTVGIYTVSVINSCGVVTTNTISVLLIGNIVAGFQTYIFHPSVIFVDDEHPPVVSETGEYIHFENLSLGNNLIYNWDFGNGDHSVDINPNETFDTVGVFQVHLYDSDSLHCKDTASATVVLSGRNTVLIIPNSFTPNNDNVENVFAVNGTGVTNFKCQISDKWGNLLYQWNNLNGSWNGIASNGHVFASGNYFYLLSYTDYYGINQSRSGIITLK